jgi:hypothetical protein
MAKKTTIKKQKVGPKPKSPMEKKIAVFFMAVAGDIKLLGGKERAKLLVQDFIVKQAKEIKLETN